jgi:glycerol-3-phosphate acyltransferase PlsX
MRLGVDVMGGDNAPDEILTGCLEAVELIEEGDVVVVAGQAELIKPAVERAGLSSSSKIEILDTREVIAMDDSPVEAVRGKRDSSIVRLAEIASKKAPENERIDAWISAGNTGACVTAASMYMRRLPGVHRPGIVVPIPTFAGRIVIVDVGANIEPKPHHLAQYGVMGAIYAEHILGIKSPRVALMNVGGEEQKGTSDMKEARDMLRATPSINFTGYIEGRGVFDGDTDVVVTDGVVGNVMLKLAEGLSGNITKALVHEVVSTDPELAERIQSVVKGLYAKYDWHEHGGAPLMGANGYCFISHGSSKARTIKNAILRARSFVEIDINKKLVERLKAQEEVTT